MKANFCIAAVKSLLRLIAYLLPEPNARIFLYRLSGIRIEKDAYINMYVIFEDEYKNNIISIGKRVAIAKNVSFIASSHPNNSILSKYKTKRFASIVVENDVWIGTGAVILPGNRIGKYSIIGANAVVTYDVEPFSIISGVPGKKTGDVRDRFGVKET